MAKVKLINHGSYGFIDISSEISRTYVFPNGEEFDIEEPQWLAVSDSGHRVLDINEISHFIPYGWIHLLWGVKDGEPHFVK